MTCVWRSFAKALNLPLRPRKFMKLVKTKNELITDVLCNNKKCDPDIVEQTYRLINKLHEKRIHDGYFLHPVFDPLCMFVAHYFNVEIKVKSALGEVAGLYLPIHFDDEKINLLAQERWLKLKNKSRKNKRETFLFPRTIVFQCETYPHLSATRT